MTYVNYQPEFSTLIAREAIRACTAITGDVTVRVDNADDHASLSRSRVFATGSDAGDGLSRFTNTSYFRREHYEIPTRFVRGNTEVGSFSNCQACHRNADAGVYNEHQG